MHEQATGERLARGLEMLSRTLHYAQQKQGAASGVSALQAKIIDALERRAEGAHQQSAYTVSALAIQLTLTKATVSDAVRVLEEKQLLRKQPSRADNRSQLLLLTPKGKQLAAKLENYAAPMRDRLAALSEEEQSAMWLHLLSLLHGLETHGLASGQKMCFTCRHLSHGASGEYFCNALQLTLTPPELRLECEIHSAGV